MKNVTHPSFFTLRFLPTLHPYGTSGASLYNHFLKDYQIDLIDHQIDLIDHQIDLIDHQIDLIDYQIDLIDC